MNLPRLFAVFIFLSLSVAAGAREVTVRLFAQQELSGLVAVPLGCDAYIFSPAGYDVRRPGGTPIGIADGRIVVNGHPEGTTLVMRGPWRLVAKRTVRTVNGMIRIVLDGGALLVTVSMSLEDYLVHVLAAEAAPWGLVPRSFALHYLAAQAVACRSYALYHLLKAVRHDGFDFCDTTHCQAFRDPLPDGLAASALALTRNRVLVQGGTVAPAFYSSTVPAVTVLPSEVWGDAALDGFFSAVTNRLSGAAHALSAASPHNRWVYRMPAARVSAMLAARFGIVWDGKCPEQTHTARGVLRAVRFGREEISGDEFRNAVCQATDWGTVRSLFVRMRLEGDMLVFEGRGLGHGIGLCQFGALELARQGWTWTRILGFYYPRLDLGGTGGDE